MDSLRIALTLFQYDPVKGGVERHVAGFLEGLISRGHDCHVFAHRAEQLPEGATFHEVNCSTWTAADKFFSFSRNLQKALSQESFDIVHGFGKSIQQDVYRVGGGSHREYMDATYGLMKSPLTRWIKLLDPRHRTILKLERQTFSPGNYRHIIFNSRRIGERMSQKYEIPKERWSVIYNGVDTERFTPENKWHDRAPTRVQFKIKPDEFLILFVGSGFKRKGVGPAIQALATLPDEMKARLLVCGKGDPNEYASLLHRLKVRDKVIFMGTHPKLERIYPAADAFLLPTSYDPFPNACLEAMACGIPPITTDAAGTAEIIRSGENGYVVANPNDISGMAAALTALHDEDHRRKVSLAARVTAEPMTHEANLEATLVVYERVLEEKRS